ncbi:hypothetical protein [Streptomyces sp. TN58]|uniref:hypothetical protein n=1 Tax=Streptomyces sp. TN58 TaxID=234612 RepID=UPI0009504832|nr:hypothetical protein [Streptomyces sp. TN58]APU41820.1 hypothetical protein BSL84_20660 [Streptomyces sp. TN58]
MHKAKIATLIGFGMAAASLITAPSAAAATTGAAAIDCTTWQSGATGYARCSGLLPFIQRFRVKVTCIDSHGTQSVIRGDSKQNGQTSSATCPGAPNAGIYKLGYEQWMI